MTILKCKDGGKLYADYEVIIGDTVDAYIGYEPGGTFHVYKKSDYEVEDRGLRNGEKEITVPITPFYEEIKNSL